MSNTYKGLIMYFPTRSDSVFVLARTRLWTEDPVCRLERRRRGPALPAESQALGPEAVPKIIDNVCVSNLKTFQLPLLALSIEPNSS